MTFKRFDRTTELRELASKYMNEKGVFWSHEIRAHLEISERTDEACLVQFMATLVRHEHLQCCGKNKSNNQYITLTKIDQTKITFTNRTKTKS